MNHVGIRTCLVILLFASGFSYAQDCWMVTNIKGYSAFAQEHYKFSQDGMRNPMVVCFTSDGGTVSGTDTRLLKFGSSTLAGFVRNDLGNELFEVYQLDREERKLLYVKSRIAPETPSPTLPNIVAAFVGDAARIAR